MGRYHIATGKFPEEKKPKIRPCTKPTLDTNFRKSDYLYLGKNKSILKIPIYPTDINISEASSRYGAHVTMSFAITTEQAEILYEMTRDNHNTPKYGHDKRLPLPEDPPF
jgi:hypothetical protein